MVRLPEETDVRAFLSDHHGHGNEEPIPAGFLDSTVSLGVCSAKAAEHEARRILAETEPTGWIAWYHETRWPEIRTVLIEVLAAFVGVCHACGGSPDQIQGCRACCRDCGFPCDAEKDGEGFHVED